MTSPNRIKIFSELPDEAYEQVESMIRWREYQPDNEIILYKQKSTEVYFIRQGHVRATLFSSSGREVSYQDLTDGDIFGELSAIDDIPTRVAFNHLGSMSADEHVYSFRFG